MVYAKSCVCMGKAAWKETAFVAGVAAEKGQRTGAFAARSVSDHGDVVHFADDVGEFQCLGEAAAGRVETDHMAEGAIAGGQAIGKVVGADDVDPSHGIYISQSDLLFQAALDGLGVALLANVMADPEVAAGRLVQPFSTRLPVKMNYHLVTSPQKAAIDKVSAFRAWILEQSAYLRES